MLMEEFFHPCGLTDGRWFYQYYRIVIALIIYFSIINIVHRIIFYTGDRLLSFFVSTVKEFVCN